MFKDGNAAFYLAPVDSPHDLVAFCVLEAETEHFDGRAEDVVWM